MPLPDIRLVLASWSGADTGLVRRLLKAHLRRLEQGLADARSEFSALRALLDHRENAMTSLRFATVRVPSAAPELAAALDAVRFAASTDPELPMLGGVLFDIEGERLHLVATDRYRMAVAQAGIAGHDGSRVQVIVPTPLADAMRALLDSEGPVSSPRPQGAAPSSRWRPFGRPWRPVLSVPERPERPPSACSGWRMAAR